MKLLRYIVLIVVFSGLGTAGRSQTPSTLSSSWATTSARGTVSQQPPTPEWWTSFQDAELTQLIQRAVASNLDLQLAAARVEEARAVRGIEKSALYPSLGASTSVTRQRERVPVVTNAGSPAFQAFEFSNFQIGFDSAWELDVFGRIRNEVNAATNDVRATEEDRRDVLVILLGDVATTYADLRGFQLRLQIAEKNIQTQTDTVALTQARAKAGLAPDLDVERAIAQQETTSAVVPSLEAAIASSIYRLSVLLGAEPVALRTELEATAPVPPVPPEVPVGLPSDLLKRRPDVRRAEAEIAAAAARVKGAKAEYFPRFTLLGAAGRQATQLHDLSLSLGNFFFVGPAVTLPIFTGGRIRSNIALQKARLTQAQLRYRSTVLVALQETEDALVNYSFEQERRDHLQDAVARSQTAVQLSQERYRSGLADFLTVLDAERQLYNSEDLLAQSQIAVTTNLIALYKALGGGWEVATPGAPVQPNPAKR
jgi:NodT family efflux transporter outer membrane factor (OMF) lipoprotein